MGPRSESTFNRTWHPNALPILAIRRDPFSEGINKSLAEAIEAVKGAKIKSIRLIDNSKMAFIKSP